MADKVLGIRVEKGERDVCGVLLYLERNGRVFRTRPDTLKSVRCGEGLRAVLRSAEEENL